MKTGMSFSTLHIWSYKNIENLWGQKDKALQNLFDVDCLLVKFTCFVDNVYHFLYQVNIVI